MSYVARRTSYVAQSSRNLSRVQKCPLHIYVTRLSRETEESVRRQGNDTVNDVVVIIIIIIISSSSSSKMAESKVSPVSVEPGDPIPLTYWEYLCSFVNEIIRSPINLVLVAIIARLVYKIFQGRPRQEEPAQVTKELAKMRRDFTLEELKEYNGTGSDGRILVAVNGNVYDVTKGARFYGPGGPYAAFGGRDASRGLATFSVVPGKDEYDDLSDLNTDEMNSIKEWEEQFKETYEYVGKLLKPGDAHTNYSDEEEEGSQQENESKIKRE